MGVKAKAKDALPIDPGRYGRGDGLWIQVRDAAHRSWIFRYKRNGKGREMGLGTVATVTELAAIEQVKRWREVLSSGRDPLAVRREEQNQDGMRIGGRKSFAEVAELCIAKRSEAKNWRGHEDGRSWSSWTETFIKHVYPKLKGIPISEITMDDVLTKVLRPIWAEIPVQAEKIRDRMRVVFDWAISKGWRVKQNPAVWNGVLDKELPKLDCDEGFYPAVHWTQIHEFYYDLTAADGVAARALEFLLLTGVRSQSVRFATWGQIDFKKRKWSIPGKFTKSGKPFETPLSSLAIKLLMGLDASTRNESDLIFPSPRKGVALTDAAMSMALKTIQIGPERKLKVSDRTAKPKYPDKDSGKAAVPHGFRSTLRDYFGENLPFPDAVVEYHLDHVVGTVVSRRYKRENGFEIRRLLAEKWAQVCLEGPELFNPERYMSAFARDNFSVTAESLRQFIRHPQVDPREQISAGSGRNHKDANASAVEILEPRGMSRNMPDDDNVLVPKAVLESLLRAVAQQNSSNLSRGSNLLLG